MACAIEIQDITDTWNIVGILPEVPGLSTDRIVGILTTLRKDTDQASDEITSNGLGTYGLQLRDLQLTGIVKKGIAATGTLADILSDASVFTGKSGVNSVDDLLGNDNLQAELITDVIKRNMDTLRFQGVISGDENEASLATVAGVSAKYPPEEVKDNIFVKAFDTFDETTDSIFGFVDQGMEVLGIAAKVAVLVVALRTVDVGGLLKGIGGAIVSLPTLATDTIDQAATNLGFDKIVGSKRVPSAGDATKSAGDAASSLVASGSDLLNKATSKLPRDLL